MEKKGRHSMEERFRAIGNLLARRSLTMERTKDLAALPEEHSTLFEGWLMKEGRNLLSMTKWQRRYFVLNETRLVYWNTEADCRAGLPPKGVIDLTGCSLAMVDQKKRAHAFGIYHPQRRDYLLEAQSKRELLVWMKKVEGALLGRERKVPSLTDFELLKVVGKGASGVVLQVRKLTSGQIYAMKVLSKQQLRDAAVKGAEAGRGAGKMDWEGVSSEDFERELSERRHLAGIINIEKAIYKHWIVQSLRAERRILEVVNHPFIVKLHFAFQTEDKLCLVMDFVHGGELYTHISTDGRFDEPRARFYAAEVLLALEYLHSLGICYRDLKPENILLDSDGHVKLADFGHSTDKRPAAAGRLYSLVGSPYYMAPEIFLKTGHGKEVDLWSLGVLVYEMLVGLPPLYSDDTSLAYQRLLTEEITYPPHVSEAAVTLMRALLVVDPARRFGGGNDPAGGGRWEGEAQLIREKWGGFAWLAGVEWEQLLARQVEPPFRPKVAGPTDVSNFAAQFTSEAVGDIHGRAGGGGGGGGGGAGGGGSGIYPAASMFSQGDCGMFEGFDYFSPGDGVGDGVDSDLGRESWDGERSVVGRTSSAGDKSVDGGVGGSGVLDRFEGRVARMCEDLQQSTAELESQDITRRFGAATETKSVVPPSKLSKVHSIVDRIVTSPKEQLQSWLAKGLQTGACRSPRRSKASQDGYPLQFPPGGEADPAHGASPPSTGDPTPDRDRDSKSRAAGEVEAADLRTTRAGRWGSESLGLSSKGGENGLKGGNLRLVQARTDLADEG